MIVLAVAVAATIALWPEREEPAPRVLPELDLTDPLSPQPLPLVRHGCVGVGRWVRRDFDREIADSVSLVP